MSQGLRDRVWITAHIRMRSESRLRTLSRRLTYVTVWYSTMLTCLTVYQLVAPKDPFRDATSAALAIAVLALSMFVPSLNLDQQADRFRECYLKLQRLLDTVADDEELQSAYYDVLDAYPNHPPTDRTDFIVSAYLNGQEVTNSGRPIETTRAMLASYWFRQVRGVVVAVLGGLAPALLYFLL
jgi:hypothetical protein